jgi:thiamine transport system permease protein
VAIYRQTVNFANLPFAAALSLVQILFTLGFASVYARLQHQLARPLDLRPRWTTQHRPIHPYAVILIVTNSLVALTCLGLPLLTLVIRSFGGGLRYYAALWKNPRSSIFYVPPMEAVFNSLKLAGGATVLALLLGTLAALALHHRRQGLRWLWDALFMLPLGTSSVTLGLGYLLAMDEPPLDLRGSAMLIVFGHTLVALPFVVRSVLPALQSIRPALREAATVLGASPPEVFVKVDLPIIWRALAVGAVFAFTVSMGEFGATSMIARPDLPTIPIAIYRFLSRPGALNYGQALAMATILMSVCVVGFVVMAYIRPPGERLF